MNWDAVGAIGEIVGAVAVVATLFYLAYQIRQNSNALERSNQYANAGSIHATNASYAQVFSQLVHDAELASIYHRALHNEPLGAEEQIRFTGFLNTYFAWVEDVFHQELEEVGFLNPDNKVHTADFYWVSGPYIIQLLSTMVGREWWLNDPSCQFVPEFRQSISQLLESSNVRAGSTVETDA